MTDPRPIIFACPAHTGWTGHPDENPHTHMRLTAAFRRPENADALEAFKRSAAARPCYCGMTVEEVTHDDE